MAMLYNVPTQSEPSTPLLTISAPKKQVQNITNAKPVMSNMHQNTKGVNYKKKTYGKDLVVSDNFYGKGRVDGILFDVILDQYDIGDVVDLKFPDVITKTSRKVIIETTNGGFFLKEKPVYCCNEKSLELSAHFQSFLSAGLNTVPPILYTTNSNTYVRIGHKVFMMTPYIAGRIFNGSLSDVKSAANALVALHSRAFLYEESFRYEKVISAEEVSTFVGYAEDLPGTEKDPWKKQAIQLLKDTIVSAQCSITDSTPYIIIHGDFAPFNMVFDNDNGHIIGINDFDNCSRFPRIRDLAEAALTFSDALNYIGNSSSYRRPIACQFSIEKMHTFLSTYSRSVVPSLTEEEKHHLPNEMKLIWVELMALGIIRGDFNFYDITLAKTLPSFIDDNIKKIIQEVM